MDDFRSALLFAMADYSKKKNPHKSNIDRLSSIRLNVTWRLLPKITCFVNLPGVESSIYSRPLASAVDCLQMPTSADAKGSCIWNGFITMLHLETLLFTKWRWKDLLRGLIKENVYFDTNRTCILFKHGNQLQARHALPLSHEEPLLYAKLQLPYLKNFTSLIGTFRNLYSLTLFSFGFILCEEEIRWALSINFFWYLS